jgi:hypothetical protein
MHQQYGLLPLGGIAPTGWQLKSGGESVAGRHECGNTTASSIAGPCQAINPLEVLVEPFTRHDLATSKRRYL